MPNCAMTTTLDSEERRAIAAAKRGRPTSASPAYHAFAERVQGQKSLQFEETAPIAAVSVCDQTQHKRTK